MKVVSSQGSVVSKTFFCFALCALLSVLCSHAAAQQQAKMPKIGWLSPGSAASSARIELFLREFRKFGYVEGKNVTFERRSADDQLARLVGLADELVRVKVDVLLTPGANGALALKKATNTIPIVFIGAVSDPVAAGLVDSLARPGGNITGFTNVAADLTGKRLELLKQTIPSSSTLRCCGIQKVQAVREHGPIVNCRHENWVYNSILWK